MSYRSKIRRLRVRLAKRLMRHAAAAHTAGREAPLRARLLSAEQMERHGIALARAHRCDITPAPDQLLGRLTDNQRVLEHAVELLTEAVRAKRRLAPAGEWLLDNIYLIEEQVGIARRHLPPGYSRELPRLTSGVSRDFPRVYDIALNAISHGDGRVDAASLSRFVAAYQTVTPLKLGELWAIPIMLRLALIENLRRVSARIIDDREDRNLADQWADRLTGAVERDPKSLVLVVADMARSRPPLASSFVAELARRLQGQSSSLALPLTWVEQWLGDTGTSIEKMVQLENQQQAAAQVSVSNSIASLRFLAMMDWREFVEALSVVEATLREDPNGTYGRMDFATRDHYRHMVEQIARRGKLPEADVATATLALAQARAAEAGADDLRAHVGYYLVDDGRPGLNAALQLKLGVLGKLRVAARRMPLLAYALPIFMLVALFTEPLLEEAALTSAGPWALLVLGVLAIIAYGELGVSLVNWVATLIVTPRALPRLDYSKGVPSQDRTLVVVPSLFGSERGVRDLVEGMEVRFLANRDSNLQFALLTDFFDADSATLEGDEALLELARREVEALNGRYATEGSDVFFLFHRPRRWNPREGRWIGEERKRGKLADLNAFLRGGEREPFLMIVGNTELLGNVRYVITLDTDTQLPRDAARELVGTLAHPLNRARFDEKRRVVTRGYGILQPRVGISMSGQARSWYARLYGSEPGIDPYTRAVSDVYQDVFGEGSFVGKGIYDVDAFETALDERLPPNRILSHDLLEGCYARAGLVSDVQLYEDYPARYAVDVKRRHRWIRGDWQLLPWLLPRVPRDGQPSEPNPLSVLSRGKLADNLRRSLVPAAITILLVTGWLLPALALDGGATGRPGAWTLWVLAIFLLPPLVSSLADLTNRPADMPLAAHLRQAWTATGRNFARAPLSIACLPYEAWFSLGAITRTLWRMLVTRRHLLQWNPSSEVERTLGDGLLGAIAAMWFAPVFAIATGAAIVLHQPAALPVALPVLLAWAASPLATWWLGRPRLHRKASLSTEQVRFLGRLARRTWAFFEDYVTAEDNWLPPDNVQEHPSVVVARRTSPTNIGLALLANVSAYDFGHAQVGPVMHRTTNALDVLETLPRHRGHFYNWYDTETMAPLPPLYVSTVDSGNLAGHLLTLRQGLLGFITAPVLAPCTWTGLADTAGVLRESLADAGADAVLAPFMARLAPALSRAPATLAAAAALLDQLTAEVTSIDASIWPETAEARSWLDKLHAQCEAGREELRWLAPWLDLGEPGPSAFLQRIPSLHELLLLESADTSPSSAVGTAVDRARHRIVELQRLAHIAGQCAIMEWGFLYDPARHLLAIGYNADESRRDPGYYDLLASEARLGNFVAIAQSQLPQESWFALGRLLTEVDGAPTLLSWSGSMFEYLMPQLVMPSYEGTLLDQTARNSVARQIAYGAQRNVPWGISESAYQLVDARMNYQYRAFGVPGLGLKRGLAQDLVIAPYASMMALMVMPEEACANLQRLHAEGFHGRYGMYEAIDYTPSRMPPGEDYSVIKSFMVHHQGMGLLALDYLLREQPMQRRFVADPEFQATLLLLQERIPRIGAFQPHAAEAAESGLPSEVHETKLRIFRSADTTRPAVQMLSNGYYHVMLSSAGGGYSRAGEMAVTRWREDTTRDHWGSFTYVRDLADGDFWSTTFQPAQVPVDQYEAIFSDAKAEFRGRRRGIETHQETAVSPEDHIELRRLRVSNRSREVRTIEVTSYAEVVLAPAISDELHPAFSNLFVQTELVRAKQAILATRRPRAHDERPPYMFHLLAVHDADIESLSYETDRARFVGRGNTLARPDAMTGPEALSDSAGSVLDPIVSVRCRVTLQPGQTATFDLVTGIGATRDDCVALIDKYRDRRLADRVFDLAWTHSQVVRHQINASQADAQLYERLAGMVLYAHPELRADANILLQNRRGQSGLWGQAISGDMPVVLVQIADADNIELVRQLVQAHAYWRLKGLAVDLVIWNEDQAGYRQQLNDQIMDLITAGVEAHVIDRPGGIFIRSATQLSHEDRVLVQTVARVVLSDAKGKLAEQMGRRRPAPTPVPLLVAAPQQALLLPAPTPVQSLPGEDFADDPWPFERVAQARTLANDLGGFSPDGREYIIDLAPGQTTPMPWSNVLANEQFGSVVSESHTGYTWAENAHEFRLTPWHNDPVLDVGGEAFYLRDDESGRTWSPTPLPRRGEGTYRTRHGFGYTVYEHTEDGIASELWVFVGLVDPIKYSVLKVHNRSGRPRRISATGYVEWVLGDLRARTQMHVVSETDGDSGLLVARNPYNTEFDQRVAFFDVDAAHRTFTTDRTEFLGRNGSLSNPDAMKRQHLSGRLGAGLDPCAAIQVPIELAAEQSHEMVFRLGLAPNWGAAVELAKRRRGTDAAHDALDEVRIHWLHTLGTIKVQTPEPALDVLANGWLLYQTIACRFLARSGYYQSGGAYGFRDQLQDSMSMLHAEPQRARAHLLLSAAHQFPQGDVQHWWHPPQDRGVRTRCSDDYLWLPLAAARYVDVTGDSAVLDESVPYIEGRQVNMDEESYYDLPTQSRLRQSLYQHCVKSLQRGLLLVGEKGIPLMATGDWNDGMNRVGEQGKGESVWLGFFLYEALQSFVPVARARGDLAFAESCLASAETLRGNIEAHAWDGEWYRRAWFDDGTPIGSKTSDECQIDSISQSWSVLSGAGDPARAKQAMASLDQHLVKRDAGLIQLLEPPFDKTVHDPGYIRGYVPGVRENGGQYTHAAVWATMAFAKLGDAERAWELMRMINPVNHGATPEDVQTYKVEPYVLAADVYGVHPHVGRGGWTWYTGSAGWMYRLLLESLLGLERRGPTLRFAPCLPADWTGFKLRYRFGEAVYDIDVRQRAGQAPQVEVDGILQDDLVIDLVDDHREHPVVVWV